MNIKTKENLIDETLCQSKVIAQEMKKLTELLVKGDVDNYRKCVIILRDVKIRVLESIDYLTDVLEDISQ